MSQKNILVTGGNGFIGSHLVNHLVNKNVRVVVPYLKVDKNSYFHKNNLHKKTIFVHLDLNNFEKTFKLIKKYKIDFIFHLAAFPLVEDAIKNPAKVFSNNIVTTLNVLEAARRWHKIKGILVTSSDKAYGKIKRARETDPIGGDHPYETSKAAADLIAQTYAKTFAMSVAVTRFGNVYGEGDLNFSRIVPSLMKSIITKKPLKIRSNGHYIRDYVYADDVVSACLKIATNVNNISGHVFNISSRENLSVLQLVHLTEKILNVHVKYEIMNSAVNEIPVQSVDFSKIRRKLGWTPNCTLEEAIPKTFRWYQNYFNL